MLTFDQALDRALKDVYAEGKNLYLEQRYDEAASHFRAALDIDPTNDFVRLFLRLTEMHGGGQVSF
jgi:tetratricopeptide (TPR) repeat protein